MAIIAQKQIFGWNEIDGLGDLERLRLVVEYMPDEKVTLNKRVRPITMAGAVAQAARLCSWYITVRVCTQTGSPCYAPLFH